MATQERAQPEVMPRLPKCPHCKKDLDGISMFQWICHGQSGQAWLVIAMYCPTCAIALDFGSVPLPPDGADSRIQIPS
jgi:hypothetical protein